MKLGENKKLPYIRIMMKHLLTLSVVLCGLILLTACGNKKHADFAVRDAFVRTTPLKTSAGYVIINSKKDTQDALVAVTADWAGKIEIHNVTQIDDGVMEMNAVDRADIPARGKLALRPGGMHIMIFDLKEPLNVGETRKATLQFQNSPPMDVVFKVKPITYKGVTVKSNKQDKQETEPQHHHE
jgi:copper(I)-binding protein